ncbi:hypothetical protein QR680_010624 [Steinernema hermaphroditum]|uniref:Uncharacterized protein n=1 Tax=Steinernema hermaphroditum TaxID=289476 RepID=A0AA39MC09_9BILA|nr:hypothetical protein QR680_010624 [Steinernema hermaphroditum]
MYAEVVGRSLTEAMNHCLALLTIVSLLVIYSVSNCASALEKKLDGEKKGKGAKKKKKGKKGKKEKKGKKAISEKEDEDRDEDEDADGDEMPESRGANQNGKKKKKGEVNGSRPLLPKDKGAVAGTHDPNYMTLNNLDNDCFLKNKPPAPLGAPPPAAVPAPPPAAAAPPPPLAAPAPPVVAPLAAGNGAKVAGTHDPNYQTLAIINQDVFAKNAVNAGPVPRAPVVGAEKVAPTHDPNYQTLALFKNKDMFAGPSVPQAQGFAGAGFGGAGPAVPRAPDFGVAGRRPIAATNDPNYQTLCNLNNDCFGLNKGAITQAQETFPVPRRMGGTDDPQYQNSSDTDNEVFNEAD